MVVNEVLDVARAGGFSDDGLVLAVAVAKAESGWDPKARAVNTDARHSVDRGLWQINSFWHPEVSDDDAFDPAGCARAAFAISDRGRNWKPWSTFNNGSYRQFEDAVRQAMGSSGGAAPAFPLPADGFFGVSGTPGATSTGGDVTRIQQRLLQRGWKTLPAGTLAPDGGFGPVTKAFVEAFQKDKTLAVDGMVGPVTWNALWLSPVT
jgi:peptidoglycan hydrolase-like protein with peptidoglycan-binding domain